jgi:purine-binding chemotaxis protein CheW
MTASTMESPAENTESDAPQEGDNLSQIVSFRLAREEYGVDIMHVQEIILIGQVTEMPQVPGYVRGLTNLRGHVIPIIDLRVRFGLEISEQTEHSRIIVLNVNKKTIGIVVDEVDEVLRINADQIEPAPPGVSGVGQQYVGGLVKFENKLPILLKIEQVMADEEASSAL